MTAGKKIIAGMEDAVAFAKGDAFARVTLKQSRGPTLEFEGLLLASTEWEARDGNMRIELWQSRGGALIPVTRTTFDSGRELVSATVVEPKYRGPEIDEGRMRFEVMDAFDWNNHARSMVRELGWKLKQVVE